MKVELEDWQVKSLREYFGQNDSTQTSHWAFPIFDKAHKKQLNLPVVGVTLKDKEETDFNYKGITYKNAESVTEFHKINGIKEVDGLFVDKKGRKIGRASCRERV